MADRAGVAPTNKINDLRWKPGSRPSIGPLGFFPGSETRRHAGDPPEKRNPAEAATSNRANSGNKLFPNNAANSSAVQGVGDLLRDLAREVRRIGGRDPEAIAISKDEVAAALVGLARRLEGGWA